MSEFQHFSYKIPVMGNIVPYGFKGVLVAIKCLFKRIKAHEVEISFAHTMPANMQITDVKLITPENRND